MDIIQFPMFEDNYGYLLHSQKDGKSKTVTIDPGDAPRVISELEERGWTLDEIWNTHHHWDHAGGNEALRKRYHCRVVAPRREAAKIGNTDREVGEGDTVDVGDAEARVIDVGGHTLGHVAYYFEEPGALFCGDTVFGLGCGRLFEGTPEQMWASLERILSLPGDTKLYCAHEYFMVNAPFAQHVDPQSEATRQRIQRAASAREKGIPTVPMLLSDERTTNPFLRCSDADFVARVFPTLPRKSAAEAFALLRKRRDEWKPRSQAAW